MISLDQLIEMYDYINKYFALYVELEITTPTIWNDSKNEIRLELYKCDFKVTIKVSDGSIYTIDDINKNIIRTLSILPNMSISERTIYPSENYIEKLSDHIIFNRRINIQDFHNFNRSHIHDILELLSKWLSVHD